MSLGVGTRRTLTYYAIAYTYLYGAYYALRRLGAEPTIGAVVITNTATPLFLLFVACLLSARCAGGEGSPNSSASVVRAPCQACS